MKLKLAILFLLTVGLLPGCAIAPIGMFNGFSKNPMSKLIVVKYPEGGAVPYITWHEWTIIKKMAKSCQAQISPQMSSPAESVLASGFAYGAAGAIGVGIGSLFLPGTIFKRYAGYGGAAGAVSGGVYGLIMWSYNDVSTVASCAKDFVHRHGLQDIFIYPAYVRARHPNEPRENKSHTAPTHTPQKEGLTIVIPTDAGRSSWSTGGDSGEGSTNSSPMPPP